MKGARQAILEQRFVEFKRTFLNKYRSTKQPTHQLSTRRNP